MSGTSVTGAALAVALLCAIAVGVALAAGTGRAADTVIVTARACVQLFLVALVIAVIVRTPAWAGLYLTVMLAAAAWTSSRRLRRTGLQGSFVRCGAAIAAGAATSVAVVLLTGALPADAEQVVPFTAQVIGGAMTATTLASLRLVTDVGFRWEVVEGWLALGATPRRAVSDLVREAAGHALTPALDQTRNVGIVVLPGAFVGLLLAGATPLDAGRLQLLVLVSLVAAETIAAACITRLLAEHVGATRPATPAP